jgi:hypothetical protein
MAVALIVVTVVPKKRSRVVFTSRFTSTLMRFVGALPERTTPGAAVAGGFGKETITVSAAEPPNPLLRA